MNELTDWVNGLSPVLQVLAALGSLVLGILFLKIIFMGLASLAKVGSRIWCRITHSLRDRGVMLKLLVLSVVWLALLPLFIVGGLAAGLSDVLSFSTVARTAKQANTRAAKSSIDAQQKKKTKKDPNRPITGSRVADIMMFDGRTDEIRAAKKFRNLLG